MRKIKGKSLLGVVALVVVALFAGSAMVFGLGNGQYRIIPRSDLGMHCACPTWDRFMLLPPYNTLRVQVLKGSSDIDPDVITPTNGMTVSYYFSTANETDSYLINQDPYFKSWINNAPLLFPGFQPVVNGQVKGISGMGLSGNMVFNPTNVSWENPPGFAGGIPAYPVTTGSSSDIMTDPFGGPNRTPYLRAIINLKNSSGTVLASTSTTVPVGFGGCCTCHIPLAAQHGYTADPAGSFQYLGTLHARTSKIDFAKLDPTGRGVGGPIRCSWCHWDPAMGENAAPGLPNVWPNYQILPGANFTKADVRVSSMSFSEVLHKFHTQSSIVTSQWDPNIAKNCYDCHPGNNVNCYRDGASHKSLGIWCTDCHGDLNQRVAGGQLAQPWQQSTLPTCTSAAAGSTTVFSCHTNRTYPNSWPGVFGKFLNSRGHMGSIDCLTCHGSPHALAPSTLAQDNEQNQTVQGSVVGATYPTGKNSSYPIGVCDVCHNGRSTTWALPPHGGD